MIKDLIEKYKKTPAPARASVWFAVCSILQRGISFFTVPVFTRLMTTEQYGMYSTYISWYTLLIVFTSLNLYYGVFNNAMLKFEDQRDRYISSMQGLVALITFIYFCIYLLFRNYFNKLFGMPPQLVLLLFLELLFTPALHFWMVRNRFDFSYKKVVALVFTKSLINPTLGILFVLFSEQKDVARVISTVLVEVLVGGSIACYQFYKGRCLFDGNFWKYAVLFNVPLLPHYLSGSVLNQGDRVMISNMVGKSSVALYSLANNLGQVLNIFTTSISASFTPWFYKELKNKRYNQIGRVANFILLLMAGLITALVIMAPEILSIIAPPKYADAVRVIPPVAGSAFFILMYNILANCEFYYAVRKYVTIGSVSAALMNLLLNYIFIRKLGYWAAGYTTLFCYIIYGLSHLYFSKKVMSIHHQDVQLFDSGIILMMSAYIVAFTMFINYLYPYFWIRLFLLLLIVAVFLYKRELIIGRFKAMRKKRT